MLDGTVDCIASHHLPQHTDHKVVEFEYAKAGMLSLETAFAVVRTSMPGLPFEQLVNLFSIAPRKLFGLAPASIEIGANACISFFQPDRSWTPQRFASKSRNSPFIGKSLTGLPAGIINGQKVFLKP